MPVKIIIADDHKLFREGLKNLLISTDFIEIVAEAENGDSAIKKCRLLKPDIILLDIGMPIISGIEACKIITEKQPEIKIIALSMHSERHFIKGMLEAGAMGYLVKNCTYDELITAIKSVMEGNKYLGNRVTEVLIDDYIGKSLENEELRKLSSREYEILKLFAEGRSTKEISETLFLSIKTIGTHRANLLEKLELTGTADLVKFAIKNGIISI